jgi:thiol-disulfide isomerase/thioredoxin
MKKIALVLVVLLALVGCSNPQGSTDSSTAGTAARDGRKPVPEFDLTNVAGGSLKKSDLKGKVTVIDFWATWCTPCLAEIPKYNELKEKYAGKDVEIVGVTLESGSLDDIRPKVEEFQMKYSVVVGDDKVAEGFGGLLGYPTTFLVSKDGTIFKRIIGSPPGKQEQMEKDIDTLLGEN